jgi:hypothetical protein
MPDPTSAELLLAIQQYFADLNGDRALYRDWVGGAVDGGPHGDGRYPLTDFRARPISSNARPR